MNANALIDAEPRAELDQPITYTAITVVRGPDRTIYRTGLPRLEGEASQVTNAHITSPAAKPTDPHISARIASLSRREVARPATKVASGDHEHDHPQRRVHTMCARGEPDQPGPTTTNDLGCKSEAACRRVSRRTVGISPGAARTALWP